MDTTASSKSFSTGSKISKNSNVQGMLPLEKDQECRETNLGLETTTSSTLTGESTDLQTVEQGDPTSMGSLPETRAQNIMGKIMSPQLYGYCQELCEHEWALELLKPDKASREGSATTFQKKWWDQISDKMIKDDMPESDVKKNIVLKKAAINKERIRLNQLMTPRKEVPT